MSQRERLMAIMLVVVVGGWLGYSGVDKFVVKPRQELLKKIGERTSELQNMKTLVSTLDARKAEWRDLTAGTLGADPVKAGKELRSRIHRLITESGLDCDVAGAVKSQNHYLYKDAGFKEIVVKFSPVTGKMRDFETFLFRFYRESYSPELRNVSVRVVPPKNSKRTEKPRFPVPDPMLDISFTVAVTVLPQVLDIEPKAFDPDYPVDRLAYDDQGRYLALISDYPFKPWAKRPERKKIVANVDKKTTPPPPPPPPPPPRPDKTIVGVEANNGQFFVYVRNNENLAEVPVEYRLYDSIDDGELVMVHFRGIVVKVEGEVDPESEDHATYYYYPLGGNFKTREPLTRDTQPDVYDAFFGGSEDA